MAFTFFFRDVQPLKLLCKYISENFRDHKYIHIWSAGCALGQEPYTFAILLRESMGPMIFRNVTIHATDIEKTYGPIIDRGVYEDDSLKRIPKDLFNKYFEPCDNENKYVITDEIKRRIEFKHHDLRDLNKIGDNFAGIICKNVLLHLKEQERIEVIKMFHSSLAKGGFFLTEQTQKMPERMDNLFKPLSSNTKIYQK